MYDTLSGLQLADAMLRRKIAESSNIPFADYRELHARLAMVRRDLRRERRRTEAGSLARDAAWAAAAGFAIAVFFLCVAVLGAFYIPHPEGYGWSWRFVTERRQRAAARNALRAKVGLAPLGAAS